MRILGNVIGLMAMALAADAASAGPTETITAEGASATFSLAPQEPEITTSADSITVEGAGATFRTPLQEP